MEVSRWLLITWGLKLALWDPNPRPDIVCAGYAHINYIDKYMTGNSLK